MYGLYPQERSAASTSLYVTGSAAVAIPIGANFGTTNNTRFSITSDLDLNTGNSYTGTVAAICAQFASLSVRAAGNIRETIQLQYSNIIPEYVQVSVNGTLWTRVRDLADVDSTSQIYQIKFNDDDTAYLLFGDGVYGQRLPADSQVSVNVFYGGGTVGNGIAVGGINRVLDSFTNASNIRLVSNTSVTSGGKARASITSIRDSLPSQQRQVSGLVNKEDIPGTLKRSLSWLQDAMVSRGFTNVSGIAVPTATVVALPYSSDVVDLSTPQQTELSTVLTNRGELGVQWNYTNARKAPLTLYAKVKLANRNLQSQKEAEIKKALNAVSGSSPFAADALGFNREYTSKQLEDVISAIDGVVYAEVNKLYLMPFPLSVSGTVSTTGSFVDSEIDADSEDGYYEFNAVSTTVASGAFYLPFKTDQVSTNFARDTSKDLSVETFTYGSASANTLFNNVSGPSISGALTVQKVALKQTNTVWATNQFSGTTWRDKYLLSVEYAESGISKKYYYHIMSNSFDTIYTSELSSAPINGGTGISGSLSSSNVSNVRYTIYRDMSNMTTGTLYTPNDQTIGVVYNNENTLFFSSVDALTKVPVGEYSHMRFNELNITGSASTKLAYFSALNAIRVVTTGTFVSGDKVRFYTTPQNSAKLTYKHPTYVYTLSDANIYLTFI